MASTLPTILEKDRIDPLTNKQDSHGVTSSFLQDLLTEKTREILQFGASGKHDRCSQATHCSPEASPTTPSIHVRTLLPNKDGANVVQSPREEQLSHSITETSPTTPTFSRAPTIDEQYDYHKSAPGEDSERSKHHALRDNSVTPALSNDRRVSVRWRGILAMVAGVFSQMLAWGIIMAYGTVLAFYVRYLIPGTPETLVALVGGVPPFCLLALSLPWGRLLDAGHYRELNIAAGILLTGGLCALAFTGNDEYDSGRYWAILLASIPMGIGQSIYFLAAPQMAKTWHPNHKGFAMGITNSGAAIGGVAWPLTFGRLVDRVGFREGVAVLAGISALLSIFIAIFAVPAPDFKRRSIMNAYNFRNWWPTHAFRSKVFVIHTISMAFVYLGVLTIPFFIELWARRNKDIGVAEDVRYGNGVDIDRSHELELYLLIILNACQLPGRLFGSTLCDKFSARKIHAVACFAAAIVVGSCWFEVSTFEGGEVFAAFFGLTLGIMVSLPINDVQDLLGNNRTHLLGQYAGAVYTCCCPFILAGAVISGALVEFFEVWVAPGAWCVVCFVLGGCGILVGLWMEDDTSCCGEGPSSSTSDHEGSTRCNSTNDSIGALERKESWSCPESPV